MRKKDAQQKRNEETIMKFIKRRTLLLASALMFALSSALAASVFSGIDTDNDGTMDLNEAKAAATSVFDKLDADHDATLDRAEVRGRISEQDWATADPDNDKTLTKDEYLNYVEFAFKRADKDGDGTVDAKEASTPAGRLLMHLLHGR
jgi:Ca2+-binding EF-hand superfamily protein